MKLKSIKVLLAFSLLALLGACGGGGGTPPGSTADCVWGSTNWDNCNWQ